MAIQNEQQTAASFSSTTDVLQDPTPIEPDRIKKLNHSKIKLTQIQVELEKLIDAMTQNPSILSRVSNFWGKLPLWQKIIAGLFITAPSLAVGLFAHIITCFVLTGLVLAAYIGGSIMLDDHHTHTKYSTQNIKNGVTSLAEGLEAIMSSLEQISQALAEQVDVFAGENKHFSHNVSTLKTRNEALSQEIEKLKQTEKQLRLTQKDLEATCVELKASVEKQTELLEKTQATLHQASIDYAQNQSQLDEKVKELEQINTKLSAEVAKYKIAQQGLTASLEVMHKIVNADEQQKQLFITKLTDFIEKCDTSFFEMSDLFQLEVNKLKARQKRHEKLLAELEQLTQKADQHVQKLEQAALLKTHGFYQQTSRPTVSQESTNADSMGNTYTAAYVQ